jgi:glycosyltransferase involved in cell wall biosynthesis
MVKLSVIVPAYNEEETILELLATVKSQSIKDTELEVVVIDDCSTDGTRQLLEDNPGSYDILVKLPINSGKGGAVKAGLAEASGDFIIFQDADLEYDPADYSSMIMPVLKHDADVVMGSRLLAPRYTRVHYFWHKQGNRFITLFFNIINNTTFTDIYSCYLLYRRELINADELTTFGWEQHAEILTLATSRSKVFYEVPISYHGRTYDQGKKIRAYHIISVLWTIFAKGVFKRR